MTRFQPQQSWPGPIGATSRPSSFSTGTTRRWRLAGLVGLAALLAALPAAPTGAVEPTPGQFTGGATTAVALAGPDGATIFAAIGVRVVAFRDEAGGLREVGRSAVLTEVPEALTSSDELLLATGPGLAGGAGDPRAWLTVLDGRGNVPEVLATLRLPSHQAGAVALAYAHAYVITEDGLAVASLKDPRQPRLLGHIPLPPVDRLRRPWWPGGIARVGDRLVVARPGGLFTLAIGGLPEAPQRVPGADRAGPVYDVVTLGDIAYAVGSAGVEVLDLSAPGPPAWLTTIPAGREPRSLTASDSKLAVLGADGTLLTWLDVSAPRRPLSLGSADLPPVASEHQDVALREGRTYVATGRSGLRMLRPGAAVAATADIVVPPLEQVAVAWPRVYGVAGDAGLFVLEAAAAGGLVARGAFLPEMLDEGGGAPRRVAFHAALAIGQRLYAQSEQDGLWVLDVSDPARPVQVVPPLAIPGLPAAHSLARVAEFLYVPGGDGTLYAVDTAAPGGPRLAGRVPDLAANNVLAVGRTVYATGVGLFNLGLLHVVDATTPAAPRFVRTVDFHVAFSRLSAANGYLYLSGGLGDLAVLDLAEPWAPTEVDRQKGRYVGHLALEGGRLVAAQPGWLESLSVADRPWASRAATLAALPWGREDWQGTSDVHAAGPNLVVLRHQAGLVLLPSASGGSHRALHLPHVWGPAARRESPARVSPPRALPPAAAACPAPRAVTVVLDGRAAAALGGDRSAVSELMGLGPALADLHDRVRQAGGVLRLVTVARQARRAADAEGLAGLASSPGAAANDQPTRLDLGLLAASRAAGAVEPGGHRVVLLLAGEVDAAVWPLAAARSSRLRADGDGLRAVLIGVHGTEIREALARLTGAADRVRAVTDPRQWAGTLQAAALDCMR
jgi:hypothetical protein